PGVNGQRAGFDGGAFGLLKIVALPVDQAPGQECASALRRRRGLPTLMSQDPLIQSDRVRVRTDAQLIPEHLAEPLELSYRRLPVAALQVRADELAVRLLVGRVDIDDLIPQSRSAQELEVRFLQEASRRLGPGLRPVFGKEVAGVERHGREECLAASDREGVLARRLDAIDVRDDLPSRPQLDRASRVPDCRLTVEGTSGEVHGLANVRAAGLW